MRYRLSEQFNWTPTQIGEQPKLDLDLYAIISGFESLKGEQQRSKEKKEAHIKAQKDKLKL